MKKKKSLMLLLLILLASLFNMGCSSDEESPTETKPVEYMTDEDSLCSDKQSSLTDSIVGTWKLAKQGRNKWMGPNTILKLCKDNSFSVTFGDEEWSGKFYFPSTESDHWQDAVVSRLVFDINEVEYGADYDCYIWQDSLRLYDNIRLYVQDSSHLFIRIENDDSDE